jgi:L-threonylcarbamoyladenylate synthase
MVPARVLSAAQSADLARAAVILIRGGIVALPFNGVFALVGDLEQPHVYGRIMAAKGRLTDQRLAQVCLPEFARELVDFNATHASERKITALWQDVHSLDLILPSNPRSTIVAQEGGPSDSTVLLMWTEYPPLRKILEHFRALGGKALFGSSANRSAQGPFTTTREVWREFFTQIDAIVGDDFAHLPAVRRQSSTIVDLTADQPRLHRRGSVSPAELQSALALHGFQPLQGTPPTVLHEARIAVAATAAG